MTPEAQRIAIAEACGHDTGLMEVCHCGDSVKNHSNEHSPVPMLSLDDLPNFLADLNAIHEAAMTLTDEQKKQYCSILVDVADAYWDFETVEATAAQRAEAFLRTIGKWDDSK